MTPLEHDDGGRDRRPWFFLAGIVVGLATAVMGGVIAGRYWAETSPQVPRATAQRDEPDAGPRQPGATGGLSLLQGARPAAVNAARTAGASAGAPGLRAGIEKGVTGDLIVDVPQVSRVYVDGVSVGSTPIAPTPIPLGIHYVRLVEETTGREVTFEVDVKPPPERNVVEFDFDEYP